MKTNDILAQIDEALYDSSVSVDAMRSRPVEPARAELSIPLDLRRLLARRLMENHGLDMVATRLAVLNVARGHEAPHAELVHAEARAVVDETVQRIREVVQPSLVAMLEAFQSLGAAVKQAAAGFQGDWVDTNGDLAPPPVRPSPPLPRRDGRPAWQSQYGPARRRRA